MPVCFAMGPTLFGREGYSQTRDVLLACQFWRKMLGKKKSFSFSLSEVASHANSVEHYAACK